MAFKKFADLTIGQRGISTKEFYEYFKKEGGFTALPVWSKVPAECRENWVNMPNPKMHDFVAEHLVDNYGIKLPRFKAIQEDMRKWYGLSSSTRNFNANYYNYLINAVDPHTILKGTVSSQFNNPLEGIKVTATKGNDSEVKFTDDDGKYSFNDIPAGTYTVKFEDPSGRATAKTENNVVVEDKHTKVLNVNLTLTSVTIYGIVTDTEGAALAGAHVSTTIGTTTYEDDSGEDGSYSITVPASSSPFTLSCSKTGYTTKSATVTPTDDVEVDFTLSVQTGQTYTVTCFAHDKNEQGLSGIVISLDANDELQTHIGDATTNQSGYCEFTEIMPGAYFASADPDGYMKASYGDTVVNSNILIKLLLLGAKTLQGAVKDEDGVALKNVQITVVKKDN